MFSLVDIWKENFRTYYNYKTGERTSLFVRNSLILLFSFVAAFFLTTNTQDLIEQIITVQAVLCGFSFNILFFLLSNDTRITTTERSLETEIRIKKIKKLSEEIFYNVSYYSMISVLSLIFLILVYLNKIKPDEILEFSPVSWTIKKFDFTSPDVFIKIFIEITAYTLRAITIGLLIESFVTFLRVTHRMFFLFREKISSKSIES